MSEQSFTTPGPITLQVTVTAGEIEVATVDGQESTVFLDGTPQALESARVEQHGERLTVQQQRRALARLRGSDQALLVRARVPHGSRVELTTAASDATLDGRFGGIEVQSVSGDLLVTGQLDGDAQIRTVSGDVRLPPTAGGLSARSVSGDVAAESVDGSVTVQSVSGRVSVGSLRQGKVQVQSVSGDIELGVAPGTAIDVDAGSASGELFSEIPLSATGDGEAAQTLVIRGHTASGDIRIFRATPTTVTAPPAG